MRDKTNKGKDIGSRKLIQQKSKGKDKSWAAGIEANPKRSSSDNSEEPSLKMGN